MSNAIGSGLDVSDIVTQLMKIEHKQLDRLNKNKAVYDSQLNSYSGLKGLLSKFNNALGSLNSVFNTNSYSVSSSNEAIFSAASTGGTLSSGNYQLNVTQIAQSHKVASTSFASQDTALVINGTLTVTIGDNVVDVTIDAEDSLDVIRDHLNSAGNSGFTASILSTTAVNGSAEYRLVLSSNDTGLANTMSFGGNALASLSMTQEISAATNAMFTFDGFDVERASNTVSDLLDGLVINLNGSTGASTLRVTPNTSSKMEAVKGGIQAVVDAYNSVMNEIDYNQSTAALRDSTYSLVKSQLKNAMAQTIGSDAVQSLLSLGIKSAEAQTLTNKDGIQYVSTGKLTVDMAQLAIHLNDNFQDVKQFFGATDSGLIASVQKTVRGFTESSGTISNREAIINSQERFLDDRVMHESDRLDSVRTNLIKQYSALDSYIQHYQQIGDMLSNQLAALDNFRKR